MPWHQVVKPFIGVLGGLAMMSDTTCLLTGGINGGDGFGVWKLDSTKGTMNQTLMVKSGLSMILGVALSSTNRAVAIGPALFGSPVSYSSADAGASWKPSGEVAKGIVGTVSGNLVTSLGGDSFAYTTEVRPRHPTSHLAPRTSHLAPPRRTSTMGSRTGRSATTASLRARSGSAPASCSRTTRASTGSGTIGAARTRPTRT